VCSSWIISILIRELRGTTDKEATWIGKVKLHSINCRYLLGAMYIMHYALRRSWCFVYAHGKIPDLEIIRRKG
jgi:hypothetical protein